MVLRLWGQEMARLLIVDSVSVCVDRSGRIESSLKERSNSKSALNKTFCADFYVFFFLYFYDDRRRIE